MFYFKAIFAFVGSFYRFKILGRVFDHNRDTIGLFSLTHLCGKLRCAWQWIIHYVLGSIRETLAIYCSILAALSRCMRSDT